VCVSVCVCARARARPLKSTDWFVSRIDTESVNFEEGSKVFVYNSCKNRPRTGLEGQEEK
jgi:hypothetical protein